MLFGPAFAVVVPLVGIAVGDGLVKRRPPVRTLFNMAQMAISVAAAGFVFERSRAAAHPLDLVDDAPALAVGGLVYLVVNDTLVSAVIASSSMRFIRSLPRSGSARSATSLLPYISMAPAGRPRRLHLPGDAVVARSTSCR